MKRTVIHAATSASANRWVQHCRPPECLIGDTGAVRDLFGTPLAVRVCQMNCATWLSKTFAFSVSITKVQDAATSPTQPVHTAGTIQRPALDIPAAAFRCPNHVPGDTRACLFLPLGRLSGASGDAAHGLTKPRHVARLRASGQLVTKPGLNVVSASRHDLRNLGSKCRLG